MHTRCTVISVAWSWSSRLSCCTHPQMGSSEILHDMKGKREMDDLSCGRGIFDVEWFFLGAWRRWRCQRLSSIFALHFLFLKSSASAFGVSYHPFYCLFQ
jgi:hypothetical protein